MAHGAYWADHVSQWKQDFGALGGAKSAHSDARLCLLQPPEPPFYPRATGVFELSAG